MICYLVTSCRNNQSRCLFSEKISLMQPSRRKSSENGDDDPSRNQVYRYAFDVKSVMSPRRQKSNIMNRIDWQETVWRRYFLFSYSQSFTVSPLLVSTQRLSSINRQSNVLSCHFTLINHKRLFWQKIGLKALFPLFIFWIFQSPVCFNATFIRQQPSE